MGSVNKAEIACTTSPTAGQDAAAAPLKNNNTNSASQTATTVFESPSPKNLHSKYGFKQRTLTEIYLHNADSHLEFLGKVVGDSVDYLTYHEAEKLSLKFIRWLLTNGFENSQDTKAVFIADNSLKLRLVSHALLHSKIPIIPLYNALSDQSLFEIAKDTCAQIIFCDNDKKLELLSSNISVLPDLKLIVTLHDDRKFNLPQNSPVKLVRFEDCVSEQPVDIAPPSEEDICYILCTSGSTGNPKLAVHTHLSLFNTAVGTTYYLQDVQEMLPLGERPSMYSMLPEAHILALNAVLVITILGGRVVYPSSKDVKAVMKSDMQISKPSVWVVVPLVLNRIQKEVEKELKKSQLKSAVFNLSISLSQRLGSMNPMNFVFSRIREGLGGNVKVIVCAGALLDRSVASFIERTTDARVIQGYGMTEGLCFLAHLTDKEFHCGRPMPGMKAVLKDVPDMDYWSEKNQGEICYKGTNCFAGYYHNKEETDKSFDSDGYLMSGDIGQIDEKGNLTIIDRKKNIFKLAQGEYICYTKLQDIYLTLLPMKDVYIHGSPLESSLVGIGFFDVEELNPWLKSKFSSKEFDEVMQPSAAKSIVEVPAVHDVLTKSLDEIAASSKLKGFEKVKKWKFVDYLPSVENKLLTVTMKQKRAVFLQTFEQDFISMYQELNEERNNTTAVSPTK